MPSGRPPFGFLLINLPSDHEVDGNIVTECQVIGAILHNRQLASVTKMITASSRSNFKGAQWRPYEGIGFVHLATHGGKKGIGLIGGSASWREVGDQLKRAAPRLSRKQQRVLCLSCCYSRAGLNKLAPLLKGHFTHAYHFADDKVSFATATTTWAMFYRKKTLNRPLRAIVDPINEFFGRETIAFREL